jgi:two-component system response regulator VicR
VAANKLDRIIEFREDYMKILIIEDDLSIIDSISLIMQVSWPEVEVISTQSGKEGIAIVEKEVLDVVILDIGLPDIQGFDVLKRIRTFSNVPIIVLTVNSDETDIVRALEWRADEYIIKPFRPLELLARIKLILRKKYYPQGEQCLNIGRFRFDVTSHKLETENQVINLTSTESLILYHLAMNKGNVLSLSTIAQKIWGDDYPGANEAIRVYIRHLRKKIEDNPNKPKLILTKSGLGYLLEKA